MRLVKTAIALSVGLLIALCFAMPQRSSAACEALPSDKGLASLKVTIEEAGSYDLWLRMLAPDTDHDSVFVQIDDGCAVPINALQQGALPGQTIRMATPPSRPALI